MGEGKLSCCKKGVIYTPIQLYFVYFAEKQSAKMRDDDENLYSYAAQKQ
jgi:hypothetical protein